MRKFVKKISAALIAGLMAVMMCVPAFAAEVETPNNQINQNITMLTNARFVDMNGNELHRGMGTDVLDVNNCTKDEDTDEIIIPLKTLTLVGRDGVEYTGQIVEAYDPNDENKVNLVSNNSIHLDANTAVDIGEGSEHQGVHLMLKLSMTPSMPMGMSDSMEVYFTCDQL